MHILSLNKKQVKINKITVFVNWSKNFVITSIIHLTAHKNTYLITNRHIISPKYQTRTKNHYIKKHLSIPYGTINIPGIK